MEKEIRSIGELEAEAARFVERLKPREERATLVTLSGELGAGKTAFTKAVAKALEIEEEVTSPTFVLEKIYQLRCPTPKFARLVHIDAYRLASGADLAALGFTELMRDPSILILLEWPERVADVLPKPAVRIVLAARGDGVHAITYDK